MTNRSDLLSRFLAAYETDWKERWLDPGESIESALQRGDAKGIGYMRLTLPQRVAKIHDPERLEGAPASYTAFLMEIGDSDLELPFMLVVGRASRVRWHSNRLFFASHSDGFRHFAFQRGSSALFGFDEVDTALGMVASSFETFLMMLTSGIEAGGNKTADGGKTTWSVLQRFDGAAKAAEPFWRVVLGLAG